MDDSFYNYISLSANLDLQRLTEWGGGGAHCFELHALVIIYEVEEKR